MKNLILMMQDKNNKMIKRTMIKINIKNSNKRKKEIMKMQMKMELKITTTLKIRIILMKTKKFKKIRKISMSKMIIISLLNRTMKNFRMKIKLINRNNSMKNNNRNNKNRVR